MLSDASSIDVMTPIQGDGLLMAVMDMHPWPDPNSDERDRQFRSKLDAYCRYIASDTFRADHPKVDRAKVMISILTIAPPSKSMREIASVYTPGTPSYEVLVQCADNGAKLESIPTQPPKLKPWWKFW
jgi:hypothetical protein